MSEEEICPVMSDPGCFQSGEHSFDEIATCFYCYDAGVAKEERERIIKLLESNQVLKETKLKKWLFAQGFRFAIALIKGENK